MNSAIDFLEQCANPGVLGEGALLELSCELKLMLAKAGFCGGVYCIDLVGFKELITPYANPKKGLNMKVCGKRNNLIYSEGHIHDYRKKYIKSVLPFDENYIQALSHERHHWRYTGQLSKAGDCSRLMREHGFHSKVSCSFTVPGNDILVGRFVLFSRLNDDELDLWLDESWSQSKEQLYQYHLGTYLRAVSYLNPIFGLGMINDKSRQVLSQVAQGMTRKEISESLFLTPRGVDYHIEKLKECLGASNNAHLVARAFKLRLLN